MKRVLVEGAQDPDGPWVSLYDAKTVMFDDRTWAEWRARYKHLRQEMEWNEP